MGSDRSGTDNDLPLCHTVECEVCGNQYHVAADIRLSKVTLRECRCCLDYSPWALVENIDYKDTENDDVEG